MRRSTLHALAVLASAAVASSAIAQEPTALDPTVHRHLGFFIRPELGVGYASTSATAGTDSVSLSGGSALVGVAAGGAVSENLILGGHLFVFGVNNPTATLNGQSGSTNDTELSVVGVGPELDYYVMPANVYLTATIAVTKQTVRSGGTSGDTKDGFGIQLGAGKEWWVSDHWGLGLAGRGTFSSNEDSGTNAPTWSAWSIAALFSATYN